MKKTLAFLLALVMLFTLAACSKTATEDTASASATESSAQTETAATTEQSSEEATTIVFMAQSGAPTCMYDLIDKFEAAYPEIKVEVNEVSANETYDQLVLTSQAGNPPDVYMTYWTISAATNGLAADLSEFIDMDEFTTRFTTAAQGYGEWEGKIYAIPYRSGASIIFANATMFENAGIELPYDGWTWDEFYAIAKQLTNVEKGEYGFSVCGDASDSGVDWQFWPFLLEAGGSMFDEDNHAAFNSAEGVEALNFIIQMIDEGIIPPGIASTNVDQQGELLASSKVAMFEDGPWFMGSVKEKAGDNCEIVALPMPVGKTSGSIAGGTALGISAGSNNKEAAWTFIDFMTSDESLNYWCEQFQQVSPLTSVSDSDYYQTQDYLVYAAQLSDPGTIVANHYVDSDSLNSIMRNYLQAAYLHQMTAQEALDAAAAEWDEILDEYYGN